MKYLVEIRGQTPGGAASVKRLVLEAVDEEAALEAAQESFNRRFPDHRTHEGDVEPWTGKRAPKGWVTCGDR